MPAPDFSDPGTGGVTPCQVKAPEKSQADSSQPPKRRGLIRKLFGRKDKKDSQDCGCNSCETAAATVPQTPDKQTATQANATLPASAAKPPAESAPKAQDWRESWGRANDEPAKPYLKEPLPQATAKQADPLANPESYGAKPADQIATQPAPETGTSEHKTDKPASSDKTAETGPGKKTEAGTETAANKAVDTKANDRNAKAKKSHTLFDGIHSWLAHKKDPAKAKKTDSATDTAKKAAPTGAQALQVKSMQDAGGLRQGSAAAPAAPGTSRVQTPLATVPPVAGSSPLGVESIFAAGGGVPQNVRYVPVPVVTLPWRTKPPEPRFPEPPRPEMPEAPQLNQKVNSLWVNAFTPAEALKQLQQAPPEPDPMMQNAYSSMLSGNGMANPYAMNSGYGPRGPAMLPPTPYGPYGPMGLGGMYPATMYGPRYSGPMAMSPPMPSAMPGIAGPYFPGLQAGFVSNMPTPAPQSMYAGNSYAAMGPARQAPGSAIVPVGYFTQAGPPSMTPAAGNSYPGGEQAAEAHVLSQLLEMLEDSMYPSQREWAADKLATYDWRIHDTVAQALMNSARKDPAATVRAACIRSLGKMNITTVPVITTIQALKTDRDLRVRQEAEQTLVTLIPTGAEK
jgi:hypothetical protein